MKLSQQSLSEIEFTIRKALSGYTAENEQSIITDIHIQPNPSSGELTVYNDEDKELANNVIEDWLSYNGADFFKDCERVLRNIITTMKENGEFENLPFIQPYSFVLVDDEKETVADLLLMDDETMLLNEELLKGLDEELDAFLKDLLTI
ncbi:hypothetical protein D0T50_10090 [Bacteroides sp. 214]|uniref:hypothetical protein n=1 Tax=Bacteroides sp. 214 TaxID=2302935 RepID=UPI0013D374D4|nr:hypothetical protein [Bacteroides sp. 214]NDW13244.1 hypothetical protein [Bacteroides sp. 214]